MTTSRWAPPVSPHREQPRDQVQSVSRALHVLEVVAASPVPLTMKAVARRAGLNLSTTYHLARTLAYEGYLVRHPDGRYVAGPEVARRFHDLRTALGRPAGAGRVLGRLAAATGHSAYLTRFVEGRVVVTDLAEGPASPYIEDLEVGLDASAHASAAGKALLATLSREARRGYLREQGLRQFTSRTPRDVDELETELAAMGAQHVVTEHGQFRDGVSCAAALVARRDAAEPWWALAVSSRGESVPQDVVSELLSAAGALAAEG